MGSSRDNRVSLYLTIVDSNFWLRFSMLLFDLQTLYFLFFVIIKFRWKNSMSILLCTRTRNPATKKVLKGARKWFAHFLHLWFLITIIEAFRPTSQMVKRLELTYEFRSFFWKASFTLPWATYFKELSSAEIGIYYVCIHRDIQQRQL